MRHTVFARLLLVLPLRTRFYATPLAAGCVMASFMQDRSFGQISKNRLWTPREQQGRRCTWDSKQSLPFSAQTAEDKDSKDEMVTKDRASVISQIKASKDIAEIRSLFLSLSRRPKSSEMDSVFAHLAHLISKGKKDQSRALRELVPGLIRESGWDPEALAVILYAMHKHELTSTTTMERLCDEVLSAVDFGSASTSALIAFMEALGAVYEGTGIPQGKIDIPHYKTDLSTKTDTIPDDRSVPTDLLASEIDDDMGLPPQEMKIEPDSMPSENPENLTISQYVPYRTKEWFTQRRLDPKALTRYPRVSPDERERLLKKLRAPVRFDAPTGVDHSPNLKKYNARVIANKLTGEKRTRVIFEGDHEDISQFHDIHIDRETRRSVVFHDFEKHEEVVEGSQAEIKAEGDINAHIQLCRFLGSKLTEPERLRRMSPKDALRIVSAFSKMRYRRDHVLSMLMTRLRRTEMLTRLSIRSLTSLVDSLGLLRYKDERVLIRICAQLMQYCGQKPLTHDVTVKLILGVVRLSYYDQQFISTLLLRLKDEGLQVDHACTVLHVLAKSGMRDAAFAQELLHIITQDKEAFQTIRPIDFIQLLDAVRQLRIVDCDAVDLLKKWSAECLSDPEFIARFSAEEVCMLWGVLVHFRDIVPSSHVLIDPIRSEKTLKGLSLEGIVRAMYGIARLLPNSSDKKLLPIYQEAVDSQRIKKYSQDQIVSLALSLSFAQCRRKKVVMALWTEVCIDVRCARYTPFQFVDIFEAASRLPVPSDHLLAILTRHLVTAEMLIRIQMPHFVSLLGSLTRIECKDKTIATALIREFIRPKRMPEINSIAIPNVLKSLVDLGHPESNRIDYIAGEIRRCPMKMAEWTEEELSYVYRALRQLDCKHEGTMKLLKKEVDYRTGAHT